MIQRWTPNNIICPCCGNTRIDEKLKRCRNGLIQIEGRCHGHNHFVKWIPYAESGLVKDILNAAYDQFPEMQA